MSYSVINIINVNYSQNDLYLSTISKVIVQSKIQFLKVMYNY